MPIISEVDKTKNLTIFTLTGEMTLDEIQKAIRSFWEAHDLRLNALWDVRQAKLNNLKSSDMVSLTALIGQYTHRFEERKGGKTAVVALSDLQYGFSRILGSLYEIEDFPTKLKVFRIMDEAFEWLDQDE